MLIIIIFVFEKFLIYIKYS